MKKLIALGLFALSSAAVFAEAPATATTLVTTASGTFDAVSTVVLTIVGFGIVLSIAKLLKRK